MPLPTNLFKVTWSFSHLQQGWTETLYLQTASNDIPSAMLSARALGQLRAACNGNDTQITYIRVRRLLPLPLAGTLEYVGNDLSFNGQIPSPSDFDDTGVQIVLRTIGLDASKTIFMRGIPDTNIASGVFQSGPNNWATAFFAWRASLIGANWGWLGIRSQMPTWSANPITVDQVPITGVINMVLAIPVPALQRNQIILVQIKKMGRSTLLNGLHKVLVSSDGLTLTTVRPIPFVPGYVPASGTVNFTGPNYFQAKFAVATKAVERKTGRPLYLRVGRRRRTVA